MNPIDVIGLGMGPADLTAGQRQVIDRALVLAGGKRLLAWFPDHPGERLPLAGDLPDWLDRVSAAAEQGAVAVLASGDPGFYGIAAKLVQRLGRDQVRIHPNLTAVQAAFARLGRPWQDAKVVSLHGRGPQNLWPALSGSESVALFTDPHHTPALVAAELLARGQDGWRIFVAENLGSPEERCGQYELPEAAGRSFAPLNLAILTRTSQVQPLFLGMPEAAFEHSAGLITKTEVRACALALLELRPGQTMWDLGAGCGSVGLEACHLLGGGPVWAVEQNAGRVEQIKSNRQKFGAAGLEVIHATLPAGLDDLPDPHRIFIGGGGKALPQTLDITLKRLAPGGVLLVSAVRLGVLETVRQAALNAGITQLVTQVAISRSAPLAADVYLKALSPVWLMKLVKEES